MLKIEEEREGGDEEKEIELSFCLLPFLPSNETALRCRELPRDIREPLSHLSFPTSDAFREPDHSSQGERCEQSTHMCNVTPCSLRSCTLSVVASTSFEASSRTSTFHTGALAGAGAGVEDRPFEEEEEEGTLRLRRERRAAVWYDRRDEGGAAILGTDEEREVVGRRRRRV